MTSRSILDPIFKEEIKTYCMAEPHRYGLFLPACNMAASTRIQEARMVLGLIRRELSAAVLPKGRYVGQPSQARILFDASCGGFHAALWLPTAIRLMELGIPVGFAYPRGRIPAELIYFDTENGKRGYELLPLPEIAGKTDRPAEGIWPRDDIPWSGMFGMSFRLLAHYNRRLIATWATILNGSPVEAVVTTIPFGSWSAAMVYAARKQGTHAIYVVQGLPSDIFASPCCDSAIVWSPLGDQLLRRGGLDGQAIHVAANPTLPSLSEHLRLRQEGRRHRGVANADIVVLILGQKSEDQVFKVAGYPETVGIIGAGLNAVCRKEDTVVALRPHYNETSPETEGILKGKGLKNLAVWREAPLQEDLACADLVVGMHSTAMEEAFLAGKPVIQVYAGHAEPEVDFRVLGCPLARSAKELAGLVENREWIRSWQKPEVWPAPGEIISNILEHPRLSSRLPK